MFGLGIEMSWKVKTQNRRWHNTQLFLGKKTKTKSNLALKTRWKVIFCHSRACAKDQKIVSEHCIQKTWIFSPIISLAQSLLEKGGEGQKGMRLRYLYLRWKMSFFLDCPLALKMSLPDGKCVIVFKFFDSFGVTHVHQSVDNQSESQRFILWWFVHWNIQKYSTWGV